MKYLKFAFCFYCLITLIACGKCSSDANCSAFTPPAANQITCMMAVRGYYYDKNSNSCQYYEGSACSMPPFELASECIPCQCP